MKHRQMTVAVLVLLGLVLNVVTMAPDAARAYRLFDVDDSYSVALLHMNGADASTTFTDESGKTWTAYGDAQIDTAQSVFGGGSVLLDGNDDIRSADSADWYLDGGSNSNLWTIDFRIRFNGDPGTNQVGLLAQESTYESRANAWYLYLIGNQLVMRAKTAGANLFQIQNAWDPATNTWYHIAIVKNGVNGYLMFVNGSQIGSTATDTDPMANYTGDLIVGDAPDAGPLHYYFNGWIDEVRVSKGIARWTANFTPPTSEYPDRTFQTQTAIALTATAANYQTQTASALTATAANYQTQTAAALTATAANYQTQTAAALTATEASNYQTQTAAALTATAANYQTQTAAALTATEAYVQTLTALPTSTYTPTATDTATPGTPGAIGTPQFVSTITYGDIARWNALACIGVVGGLWAVVWSINAFLIKRRRP